MRGASEGEGLGNKFLANIREADAICQVVRAFEDGDVVHVDGKVSPSSDIETIHTELILADLQTLEKAVVRLEKEARIKKESKPLLDNALAAQKVLEEGTTLYAAGAAAGVDLALASGLGLLTTKPFIYVFNLDEEQLADADLHARLGALVAPADAVFLNAKLEMDLMEMSDEDALEMLQSFGAEESGLDQLARVGFHTLGLQTYLTAGPKESRAWTIHQGWTAPQAAGVIHTDFQRGFIKAEVVSFTDLDAGGLDGRGPGGREGAHGGQGLRHAGRRRRGVPLQRVIGGVCAGQTGCARAAVRRASARGSAEALLVRSSAVGQRCKYVSRVVVGPGMAKCSLDCDDVAPCRDKSGRVEVTQSATLGNDDWVRLLPMQEWPSPPKSVNRRRWVHARNRDS